MKGIDKIAKEGAKHVFKKAFAAGAIISGYGRLLELTVEFKVK